MAETVSVSALADDYIERSCALDPIRATALGVPGHDDQLTDFSPSGVEDRIALDRDTLVQLASTEAHTDDERRSATFMTERLGVALAMADAYEHLRAVRNIASPVQSIRQVFDLMPHESAEDWEVIAARLERVPTALVGVRLALDEGRARKLVAARRQAMEAGEQCAVWGGERDAAPFFETLVRSSDSVDGLPPALRARLDGASIRASEAYGEMGAWLRDVYGPTADEPDAVGADRYRLYALASLGADIDLDETYQWGWDELSRIETDMRGECSRIGQSKDIAPTIEWLETQSDLVIDGAENLRDWLQQLMDSTIDTLDGVHFDIPEPVRRVEAMLAPPGGAAAMYYTGPSEDFSRPGRTWYPTLGKTRFPLWGEVSIAYHEGVPGHHLQVGQVRFLRDRLDRFQRGSWVSGHGEGWALYAERLMDELGFFEQPEYRLGYLRAQAMRAVRVIVDIGMHLEMEIPIGQSFQPGERWTPELGQQFVNERSRFPLDFMASEIVRYLGWPGQAISYKVGERIWLAGRTEAEMRLGSAFDLKAFHAYALDLGPLGLDQLADELARFGA